MTEQDASALGLAALGYLAQDMERMVRFLDVSGIRPGDLRKLARGRTFQAGVLDHLMSDEPLLLAFCDFQGCRPQAVREARDTLMPPATPDDDA